MKKKFIKMVVCIYSVIYSLSAVVTSYADNPIRVFLDGNEIQFDVLPQIIDDYTMVPVRAIFENLGYSVNWDQELQTVFATNTTTSNRSIVLDTKKNFFSAYSNNDFNDVNVAEFSGVIVTVLFPAFKLGKSPTI